MRTVVFLLFLVSLAPSAHASAVFRLDAESNGTLTAWTIDERESGFTWEVLAATNKTTEADLGWTFHPTGSLSLVPLVGGTMEHGELRHGVLSFLCFYQQRAFTANVLHFGFVDPRDLHASFLYERVWATWHNVGPFAEAAFPLNGVGSGVVGGIFTQAFSHGQIMISMGKGVGDTDGWKSRLTVVFPL